MLPKAISFSGCGFLGLYHVGIIGCFQKYGREILDNLEKIGGASAGSLAAAVLAICPEKTMRCKDIVYGMAKDGREMGVLSSKFMLSERVASMCDEVLPDNAHDIANGRLFISITHKDCGKNKIVSHFTSRSDLIECLTASCHIPWYSGKNYPVFRGNKCYDGGFTNNLVSFPEEQDRVLYVTPFSGGKDYICPRDPIGRFNVVVANQIFCVNLSQIVRLKDALLPGNDQRLDSYYEQGYVDGLHYIRDFSKSNPSALHFSLDLLERRDRSRYGMSLATTASSRNLSRTRIHKLSKIFPTRSNMQTNENEASTSSKPTTGKEPKPKK